MKLTSVRIVEIDYEAISILVNVVVALIKNGAGESNEYYHRFCRTF